ncbi:pyridoxal phosphate-dependent aminotransferase family protein [Tamlana sp. s12]|uniref:aminotransferase class I/II-fold pyridoxal phosphate-dependent enzyme n=1 Tax=Tamlana sp. s12 TaxID=1630406 RepID=UPI0008004457|nr:pyridoxal phosphate-dependent aminotransferase family protein [Tamlana sp. s12]OBQ56985.1 8-amino-7-oxononanoate synthase [Tamlana sp. s12]QQY82840.1 pyridoxal phosphate-dependent aminotransferase family protein [Tamlana sp. s12]
MFPEKLHRKLESRKTDNALRELGKSNDLVDFSSNDYLGFSKNETIFKASHALLNEQNMLQNGATGSRLLSGNHKLYPIVEKQLANFHNSESALIYNSGYDANIGFFASVPQRGDIILYDAYSHASIRDGMLMSHAKAYKFMHNDLSDLETLLIRFTEGSAHDKQHIYVVTESVFSMDGDSPDCIRLVNLCKKYAAYLVIDEAHGLGVFGKHGGGLIQHQGLEKAVFARIVTYGKALGCHGAAILGSDLLKQYLVNFSRSLIYTTALPPHSLATIHASYTALEQTQTRQKLKENIQFFKSEIIKNQLQKLFIESDSAIHCCIISGNDRVKHIAKHIQNSGFDVKPILSPTVSKGQERLRFCLHAYNTEAQISEVLKLLAPLVTS